ncbi:hypothetical protein H112_07179 [Trichophyton rubrum D6]|uniref:Uncharacterized protein n=4 Tax=Trichophyton TaxID=5550 RepID=A0A178F1J2_TRIRU|nr:uncharacterized protein TERG_02509 [Trichophyton rubrum CBS 118892]EZF11647.1 hypothetical protein H100_07204 [Trichophyton rubrum MR850]EZF38532.1 hypothetical protein H102_07164 [Trichophyton rubrum CBS 100081]EZF49244.1 hypothetical protein H103_07187 [Trichophyton rubrum CBS 288.86]EZF59936.1 hypothetical protein H104_07141 [Trichophyton rubrum CBS 289.86]EZF70383.1 hypothetical protein H105_07199 [Trichophyton soudanense CBS 452.61]EZF81197.1 hypothetical protein H110_07187 [Trichophy
MSEGWILFFPTGRSGYSNGPIVPRSPLFPRLTFDRQLHRALEQHTLSLTNQTAAKARHLKRKTGTTSRHRGDSNHIIVCVVLTRDPNDNATGRESVKYRANMEVINQTAHIFKQRTDEAQ